MKCIFFNLNFIGDGIIVVHVDAFFVTVVLCGEACYLLNLDHVTHKYELFSPPPLAGSFLHAKLTRLFDSISLITS